MVYVKELVHIIEEKALMSAGTSQRCLGETKLEGESFSCAHGLDYRLLCKLGEGTFSVVLKVKSKKDGQSYAMKRFRKPFNR